MNVSRGSASHYSSQCKCKVIVQADTTDDSGRSESTPHLLPLEYGKKERRKVKTGYTQVKHFNKAHLNI